MMDNQIYPSTIPPIKFGIKNTVRKRFVPLRVPVNSKASIKAMTLMVITDTTVNFTVNHKDCKKVVSLANAVI